MIDVLKSKKIVSLIIITVLVTSVLFSIPASATSYKLPVVWADANSSIDGCPAKNLIDGNYYNMWSSFPNADATFSIELDKIYDVSKIILYSRTDLYGFPVSFRIEVSMNNLDWQAAPGGNITDYPVPVKTANPFSFTYAVPAKYVRVISTSPFTDGSYKFTQLAEIEVYGTSTSYTGEEVNQPYNLKRIGTCNSTWYQFENMGSSAAETPKDAFFIPYYKTPVAKEGKTNSPAAVLYNNRWVLAFESTNSEKTSVYCKISADSNIDSAYGSSSPLINSTGFDNIKNPSFMKLNGKTYLLFQAETGGVSKIGIVEYTGENNISILQNNFLQFNINISGFDGNIYNPSFTYNDKNGLLRLYFTININEKTTMLYADSPDGTISGLSYKGQLNQLHDGKVFCVSGKYFAIFKTYNNEYCTTECAYSNDGINFTNRSIIANGNRKEDGQLYSNGAGTAAINNSGYIEGLFTEVWNESEDDSSIMLLLPQKRAVLANGYVTLNNIYALSKDTQVIKADRDYNTTDLVSFYHYPDDTAAYELRQKIVSGYSYCFVPAAGSEPITNTSYIIPKPSLSGLVQLTPDGAYANDTYQPNYSAGNVISYDNNLEWQSTPEYTYHPSAKILTVSLPAAKNVGAVSLLLNDNGSAFPNDFKIQYSTDGIEYKDIPDQTFMDFPPIANCGEIITKFNATVNTKFIRFIFTRYSGNYANMAQLVIKKVKLYGSDTPINSFINSESLSKINTPFNIFDINLEIVDDINTPADYSGDINDGNRYIEPNIKNDLIWLNSDYYSADSGFITGIVPKTTVESFKQTNRYVSGLQTSVTKNEAEVYGTALIGTGMKIRLLLNGNSYSEFEALVSGDLSGDGEINALDIIQLKNHLLQKKKLEGVNASAADLKKDGTLSILDLLDLKSNILAT